MVLKREKKQSLLYKWDKKAKGLKDVDLWLGALLDSHAPTYLFLCIRDIL
jgi:hypothetical protein